MSHILAYTEGWLSAYCGGVRGITMCELDILIFIDGYIRAKTKFQYDDGMGHILWYFYHGYNDGVKDISLHSNKLKID